MRSVQFFGTYLDDLDEQRLVVDGRLETVGNDVDGSVDKTLATRRVVHARQRARQEKFLHTPQDFGSASEKLVKKKKNKQKRYASASTSTTIVHNKHVTSSAATVGERILARSLAAASARHATTCELNLAHSLALLGVTLQAHTHTTHNRTNAEARTHTVVKRIHTRCAPRTKHTTSTTVSWCRRKSVSENTKRNAGSPLASGATNNAQGFVRLVLGHFDQRAGRQRVCEPPNKTKFLANGDRFEQKHEFGECVTMRERFEHAQ